MTSKAMRFVPRLALGLLVASATTLAASHADADVRREGSWPSAAEPVTLSLTQVSRSEAIRQLADKAGWSVVVQVPAGSDVDLHVKNEDASKVLGLLLAEGRFVAKRDGALVDIRPDSASPDAVDTDASSPADSADSSEAHDADAGSAAPPAATAEPPAGPAPEPAASPAADTAAAKAPKPGASPAEQDAPPRRGDDRSVTGGNARIGRDEIVHDLAVMGGEAEVLGWVTGDLAVMGGEAVIRSGARVDGNVSVIGGELIIEDGARVEGDVGVLGGEVVRGPDAGIRGKVTATGGDVRIGRITSGDEPGSDDDESLWSRISSALSHMALLFVFGAVMFGLAPRRMELMQTETAARPGRVFAFGVLGLVVGAIALGALCITIVGIPWAILAALLSVVAGYAGACGVLAAIGAAFSRHRSTSPYVHLGVGCLLLLVLGAIPYVGGLATGLLAIFGVGAFVATRAAGLVPDRTQRNAEAGPYRTSATV